MSADQMHEAICKALEEWGLQGLVDGAIIATFLALGIIAARTYLESLRARLSLRVVIEVWDVVSDVVVDLLLLFVAAVGLVTINPDIFADVKMALPFCPAAFVLAGVALVVRVFYGGGKVGTRAWAAAVAMVAGAALLNWFGFTFVMEAAGHEWLDTHPSPVWENLRAMRSNLNPELSMTTFLWAQPAMFAVALWGIAVGLARACRSSAPVNAGSGDDEAQ